MEKHLIAFDIDGTIVTNLTEISDFTVETLKKLKDMGHYLMPSSARPERMVRWVAKMLEANGPSCLLNGAFLYDFENERDMISPKTLSRDEIGTAFDFIRREIGEENILAMHVEGRNYIGTLKPEGMSSYFKSIWDVSEHEILRLDSVPNVDAARIVIFPKVEYAQGLHDYLSTVNDSTKCLRVDWEGVVGDMSTRLFFNNDRADKWNAVIDTAEFLGIDRKNILTFGDNWNDIQMLTENPNGYALKGSYAARQGIRETEFTCKEDGVARELVKIFDL